MEHKIIYKSNGVSSFQCKCQLNDLDYIPNGNIEASLVSLTLSVTTPPPNTLYLGVRSRIMPAEQTYANNGILFTFPISTFSFHAYHIPPHQRVYFPTTKLLLSETTFDIINLEIFRIHN